MLDRIATMPCPSAPACGGAVTLRLGYAPTPATPRRLRLRRTIDAVRQTCTCDLTEQTIKQLGAQAKHGRIRPTLVW
jgi:hypothetical protein